MMEFRTRFSEMVARVQKDNFFKIIFNIFTIKTLNNGNFNIGFINDFYFLWGRL